MVCKIPNLLERRRDTDSQAVVACVIKMTPMSSCLALQARLELKDNGNQET